MSNQLIKTTEQGKENVFPRTRIQDLFDDTSGQKLIDILRSFNMMFVPYLGNKSYTRNQISPELRRQGLWLTYVIDNTVYTEWYDEVAIDDTNWGNDSNWRQGSNALVGDLSISPNGTWVINGEDSGITIKGDKGDSPVIRIYDNKIQVSYDKGITYEDLNNTPIYTKFRFNSQTNTYQVSYDLGANWQDISDEKVYHKFKYNQATNTYQESTDFGKTWSNISAEKVYTKFRFNRSTNTYQVSTDLGQNWTDVSSDKVYYQFRYNGETNTHQVSTDFGATWTNVSEDKVFYQFRTNDNRLQVSTDLGTTWENCSEPIAAWFRWADTSGTGNVGKVQISRDNNTWEDLSPTMTNNLYIKGYVATVGDLPTSSAAIGDIYMVGPTYDESDTTQDYPHYRMWVKQSSRWVDNGEFTNVGPVGTNNIIDRSVTIEKIADSAIDDEPTAGSDNLVKSGGVYDKLADLEGKVGTFDKNVQVEDNPEYKDISIGVDGKIYRAMTHEDEIHHYLKHVFKAGIESKELKYLLEKITEKLSIEEYNKTIENLDNEEFVHVIVDSMGRILKSFDKYGKETNYLDASFLKGLHINKAEINNIDTPEYLYAILDLKGRILFSIDTNGKIDTVKDKESKEEPKNETRNIEALKIIANMPVPCSVDESGKEIVSNVSLRNLQRRANRFANIEWNALHPIASTSSHTGISVGNHRGIPYTSCMEVDRFVGFNVSILTFMTAANNPYSLLYTEDLRRNMSGYGFTYHGDRATIGGWMGIVCNIFVEYSIGMKIPFDTGSWEYLVNQGIIAPVYDVSAEGVRAGDMLWEPGHGRLVTNIWRNADGSVNKVEVMESVQDFPVKTLFTATNFDNYLANHNGKIYRYLYLYENINDSATPFEEGGDGYVYNDDVCTFAGDYASFREGYPIFINYNLKENKDWDVIEIYKDGQKVAEGVLDLSQHRIDISSMSSTYGKYKARLRRGTDYSDYTYWEVISADVECSKDDDGLNIVTFGSKNGNPMYVTFHKINGGPKATYAFSSDELNKGRCKFSIRQLIEAQYNNLNVDSTYCKVIFEGEYGRITSEPILIDNII